MNTEDTIAAVCTGTGGAIAIIRISGTQALRIAGKVWEGGLPLEHNPRKLCTGHCSTGKSFRDSAMAVYMPAPKSYTGEDVVELQCHGGGLVPASVLGKIIESGARHAEPGEFTFRAFMNERMDLAQAEAVADIINAQSSMAMEIAARQLAGSLSHNIREIRSKISSILAENESRLDFSEEEIAFPEKKIAMEKLREMECEIRSLYETGKDGVILREGVKVVIAGRPNSGKSSLLNRLLGFDRAIVTDLPGTTRDTVEERTSLRKIPVRLIDTAGIREADNIIENLGVERSIQTVKIANVVLWLLDPLSDSDEEIKFMEGHLRGKINVIAVWNKMDKLDNPGLLAKTQFPTAKISALTGAGIDEMLDIFEKLVWGHPHGEEESENAVSARHAALLGNALKAIPEAVGNLENEKWELASINLREMISALGKITGDNIEPDILGEIFSRFCIGK